MKIKKQILIKTLIIMLVKMGYKLETINGPCTNCMTLKVIPPRADCFQQYHTPSWT